MRGGSTDPAGTRRWGPAGGGRGPAAGRGSAPLRAVLVCVAPATAAVVALSGCPASGGAPAAEAPAADTSCVVGRVIDGDTFVCRDGERVRLLLVNTPEMGREPYGRLAREALLGMIPPGTRVGLATDVERRDVYGRLLAHVRTPSGLWVNHELARRGYAEVMVVPPNVRRIEEIRAAARLAREERAGFWDEGLLERSGLRAEGAEGVEGAPGAVRAGGEGRGGRGGDRSGGASEEQGGGDGRCHPSYPDVCLPPPPPDLDCADVAAQAFRVTGEDPHRLDGNGDGVACEGP